MRLPEKRRIMRKPAGKNRTIMRLLMKTASLFTLLAFALLTAAPLFFLLCGSLMGNGELNEYLGPFLMRTDGYAGWRLFPLYPTLRNAIKLLLDSPEFFRMFWNTMTITGGILAGQFLFGMPAAWGLARYPVWGKSFFTCSAFCS